MNEATYCLFDSPIGRCGIAWRQARDGNAAWLVTSFQLPEAAPQTTESRIARNSGARNASGPPPHIRAIIERVYKHLQGELQDFRDVRVDLDGVSPFVREVCEAARKIPAGQTVTYRDLAAALGHPAAARAVGRALGKNPIPLLIPCHRVQATNGRPGGFSAHGGRATKARLLAIEGVTVNLWLELPSDP